MTASGNDSPLQLRVESPEVLCGKYCRGLKSYQCHGPIFEAMVSDTSNVPQSSIDDHVVLYLNNRVPINLNLDW